MIPRSPKIELTVIGAVFGWMLLSGVVVQDARNNCLERHGLNASLEPGDSPLSYECVSSDSPGRSRFHTIFSIVALHTIPFIMGYRVKTLISRLRESDNDGS